MGEVYTPSGDKFTGEKKIISKEVLRSTIDSVKNLSVSEVQTRLEKYKDIDLGHNTKSDTNSFELVALYQRAVNLSGGNVKVNGLFRMETLTGIKGLQTKLGLTETKDNDGIPGKTTTKKSSKNSQL